MVIFCVWHEKNDRGGIRGSEEAGMIGKSAFDEPRSISWNLDLMARTVISNQVGGKYEQ
jgi:hypothetical protein